jgi:hypothetical protein
MKARTRIPEEIGLRDAERRAFRRRAHRATGGSMKKKTVRPLTLSKETIRDLNEARVENVAGGRTGASDCPAHCINNTAGGSVAPCG